MHQRRKPAKALDQDQAGSDHDKHAKSSDEPEKVATALSRAAVVILFICEALFVVVLTLSFYRGKQSKASVAPVQAPAAPPAVDILVTVYSYDRPADLRRLLEDVSVRSAETDLHVAVHIIDDNSLGYVPPQPPSSNFFDDRDEVDSEVLLPVTELAGHGAEASAGGFSARSRFRHVEAYVAARELQGWRMFVSHYQHGRRRYWHLIRIAHRLAWRHAQPARYFIFLPDDVRLASRFLDRAVAAWDGVVDARKLTLMLHIEETREHAAVWTDVLPEDAGDDLVRIGWVESGNFIAGPELLAFLNWSFPRVPIQRWVDNPPISSGVGATLSELIHAADHRMYRTRSSLVAHVGVSLSKMNAAFRDSSKPSHLTLYFADGDAAYSRLLDEAATIVASIASTWNREAALHAVVASIAPQVDHVYIYLNGYETVPSFLRAPYITSMLSSDSPRGDIGDVGKFYWANDLKSTFHLTADDDIVYPENYVSQMLDFMSLYKPPVAIGVHGINIKHDQLLPPNGRRRGNGYYGSREVFMAIETVPDTHNVHILGTGSTLYRVADLGTVDLDKMFPTPNMADIWFGIRAQQLELPLVTIPHDAGWLREVPGTFQDSIYTRSTTKGTRRRKREGDKAQTEAAIAAAPWKHFPPTLAK
jgi:hypothetical protein